MSDLTVYDPGEEGEMLTNDEKLLHKPRWQGEVRDLSAAIRGLAKQHHVGDELDIEESGNWEDFVYDLVIMIRQLSEGKSDDNEVSTRR